MSEYNLLKDYTAWRLLSAMLLVISIVVGFTHFYIATENKGLRNTVTFYEKIFDGCERGNWDLVFTANGFTIQNKINPEHILTFPYDSNGWIKISTGEQSNILYTVEINKLANATFCDSVFYPKISVPTVTPTITEPLNNELEQTAFGLFLAAGFGNYTTIYTEDIGNIKFGLGYSTITSATGKMRIIYFGYGDLSDGTVHLDIYLTDNKETFIKFFELHYGFDSPGNYLEMYPEYGGFKRKVLP